jgi:hypothetical protein
MLQPIPLFGLGNVGRSVNASAQERVNLYAEVSTDGEAGNNLTLYPTPGLTRFVDMGATPARGMYPYETGNVIFEVVGSTLWEIAADGTQTNRGTLQPTSGRVDMVDNGLQLLIVDGSFGYIYTFASQVFARITDPDFPASETAAFADGYFIVQKVNTAQFYISAVYDGTSWNPLDFATAESDPDNLVRVFVDAGVLLLFGTKTTEFWGASGATSFPFARIGSAAIEWGLAARWSLCKFDGSLIFLRKNRLGAVQVCVLAGTQAIPVSNPDMSYQFSTYSTVSNATGFSYMVAGHPFYQINFPSANVSWLYDGLTKDWSKVQYGNGGRHRAEIQVNFNNRNYVSDYANGKLYLLDQNAYTDDGTMIVRQFTGRHQKAGSFTRIPQLWLDMEAGVGLASGQGSNPQVALTISRDGGKTFGAEIPRSFGAIGNNRARAVWNRLGRARDWVMRFRVTDPVKTVFVAAWGRVEQ